jgi:hypothetical protein
MHNTRASKNLTAVSVAAGETAINTFATLDQSILVGDGDYINLDVRRENNSDEANGREEADLIYDNGATASATFNFAKLTPNQAAFALAYGLGHVETVAAGNGYLHTITPIDGDVDELRSNPSFTAMQRIGKTLTKRRFASCFVDSLTLTFDADSWVTGSASIMATGKNDSTVIEETVTALDNVTSLTLAANAVAGSTAQERLDSVQIVRAESDGGMKFATITAVSSATPAVITIESLGGSGASVSYRILYSPTEPAWAPVPARIVESNLRVSEACLYLGGSWDGSAFVGGKAIGSTLTSFAYTLSNSMSLEFTPCAGGAYAGIAMRQGRGQTISLQQKMRNMLLQQYLGQNEYFGLRLICEGAEFDTGHKYTLELIFPRLGILAAPISTNNRLVAEAGDLQVLEDLSYGSVIARVKNQVAAYAQ